MSSYKELKVWQSGIVLAKDCYLLTRRFPKEELFGLTSQIRRAAASVPANIAEGYGRENTREYIRFLQIAQGSQKELETHLFLSTEVNICSADATTSLLHKADELGRMLRALIRALQRKL
jgi:four helix bundle protein